MTAISPGSAPQIQRGTTRDYGALAVHDEVHGMEASESWLMARALARAGYAVRIAVDREAPCYIPGRLRPMPDFELHLTRVIGVQEIVRALQGLGKRGRRGRRQAMVLLADRSVFYREGLETDGQKHVRAIRRRFVHQTGAEKRRELIGVLWRVEGIGPGIPGGGRVWRNVRAIERMARDGFWDVQRAWLDGPPEGAGYFLGPRARRRPIYDAIKRGFDIGFSLLALLVTLPICVPVALLIKMWDRGPVFFTHRREGLQGRPFGCLKFRTMVHDADALQKQLRALNEVDGPQFKLVRDPRVTALGRFLRRTNIDELPQLLNVLTGQMSLVGPRPSPFEENQLCPAWREARLSVRPGITGLWQVSRSPTRGATDFQEWIYFDAQYVERRSFWLDLKILLLTIKLLATSG